MMIFTYFISCFPHDLCVAWQSLDFDHMSRYLSKLRNNKSMTTDKLDSSILLGVGFNCQERVTKKEFLKSSEPYDLLRNIQVAELSHELDRILDKMNRKFRLPCTFFNYWWWKAYLTTFCDEQITFTPDGKHLIIFLASWNDSKIVKINNMRKESLRGITKVKRDRIEQSRLCFLRITCLGVASFNVLLSLVVPALQRIGMILF